MAVLLAIYVLLLLLLTAFDLLEPIPFLFILLVAGAPLIAIVEISANPVTTLLVSASRLFLFIAVVFSIAYALLTSTITLAVLWVVNVLGLTLPLPLKVALTVVVFLFVHALTSKALRV
jgi:hypothetical protein